MSFYDSGLDLMRTTNFCTMTVKVIFLMGCFQNTLFQGEEVGIRQKKAAFDDTAHRIGDFGWFWLRYDEEPLNTAPSKTIQTNGGFARIIWLTLMRNDSFLHHDSESAFSAGMLQKHYISRRRSGKRAEKKENSIFLRILRLLMKSVFFYESWLDLIRNH